MSNAKDILLEHIGDRVVRCAVITKYYDRVTISLKAKHTHSEYTAFFDALADMYPDGDDCGCWSIDGTVWYTDGTWSVWSQNDDGDEYWQHCSAPTIPESLQ